MTKRHIKFFRYYKEWIETYKKYQISEITYSKVERCETLTIASL